AVAEDRTEPLRHRPELARCRAQALRYAVVFGGSCQPHRHARIAVAVADESAIAARITHGGCRSTCRQPERPRSSPHPPSRGKCTATPSAPTRRHETAP